MPKVYVVVGSVDYEFGEALGAFSTQTLAEAAIKQVEKLARYDNVFFDEFELDETPSMVCREQ